MTVLLLGLLIFLGGHSVRIVAEPWRTVQIARWGPLAWKGAFTLVALVGFALIVWGYGLAREQTTVLWAPPFWGRHLTALLTVVSFVLFAAAKVPGNHVKAALGHPMVLGVQLWAAAHLVANGTVAAVVLFGGFLVWSVVDFASARRRDRAAGTRYPAGTLRGDALAVIGGLVVWALFAFLLHGWLIGVRPFG